MAKWRIIFYDMLCPEEPRCHAMAQFTNKRICIFTKHKRHKKTLIPELLYHETFHIFNRAILARYSIWLVNILDNLLDLFEYHVDKLIYKKTLLGKKVGLISEQRVTRYD